MNDRLFGDRPIQSNLDDKMGLAPSAQHIAQSIMSFSSNEGFVLGIEGSWGSGKSSLVNLIAECLKLEESAPAIIKFAPWLISSRDGMIDQIFQVIGGAISQIEMLENGDRVIEYFGIKEFRKVNKYSSQKQRERREITQKKLKEFSDTLTRVGNISAVAAAFGVPGARDIRDISKSAAESFHDWSRAPSLDSQKKELSDELSALPRKIVVIIDDLDRLEPTEAGEVVRLVRAVADFPNIIYLLCYSRELLAQALSKAFEIDNGEKYIEKIVQASYSIPRPEAFDMRRLFDRELRTLFPETLQDSMDFTGRDRSQRLSDVIDSEGARSLQTPRDVIRAINAVRLYASPVIEKIDLADMVWLQLIALRDQKLFKWIESYLGELVAIANGALLYKFEQKILYDELRLLLNKDDDSFDHAMRNLSKVLPGITIVSDPGIGSKWSIFQNIGPELLASYVRDRRLGSHEHYRFYFALAAPDSVLDDIEFAAFMAEAMSAPSQAANRFENWASIKRPQGGVMLDLALGRLLEGGIDEAGDATIEGILLSLTSSLDIAALHSEPNDFGRPLSWRLAVRVFKSGLSHLRKNERTLIIKKLFGTGRALGWLTDILRDEIFAHGVYGGREKPEGERMLQSIEYDLAVSLMIKRFQQEDFGELLKTPRFMNILFAWRQAKSNSSEEIRAWIASNTLSDGQFLNFLDACRSVSATNGIVRYPIQERDLTGFVDFGEVRKRVEMLTRSSDTSLGQRATGILVDLRDDNNDF